MVDLGCSYTGPKAVHRCHIPARKTFLLLQQSVGGERFLCCVVLCSAWRKSKHDLQYILEAREKILSWIVAAGTTLHVVGLPLMQPNSSGTHLLTRGNCSRSNRLQPRLAAPPALLYGALCTLLRLNGSDEVAFANRFATEEY